MSVGLYRRGGSGRKFAKGYLLFICVGGLCIFMPRTGHTADAVWSLGLSVISFGSVDACHLGLGAPEERQGV